MIKPYFYRVDQVMILLNISRSTVFNLLAEGKLRGHNDKPGRAGIRITVKSVEEYIDRYELSAEYFLDKEAPPVVSSTQRKIISKGIE
jgi:excisionase family DNA binding protein